MSNKATISFNVDTVGWPSVSSLVHLSPALTRFDVETGKKVLYDWIIVVVKEKDRYGADGCGVDIFPSNSVGGFVDVTMTPLKRLDLKPLHSALVELGYTPTN